MDFTNFPYNLLLFEDPPAGDPPAGDPPAGDPPAGDPPAGDPPAGDPKGKTYDEKYVARLRAGEAAARADLKKREDADREAEKAKLKEQNEFKKLYDDEKADHDKTKATHVAELTQRDRRLIAGEIRNTAKDLGAKPEAVVKLTKLLELDKITIDADGEVVGAVEQLEELKKEMPFLFEDGEETSGGAGGGGTPPRRAPAQPRRAAAPVGNAKDFRDRTATTEVDKENFWKGLGKTGS